MLKAFRLPSFLSTTAITIPKTPTLTRTMSSNSTTRIFTSGAAGTPSQAEQYTKDSLDISQLQPDPLSQFGIWFDHAKSGTVAEPETVVFSSAELPSGRVSARAVLMKEMDGRGFVFYSNWATSRKAADVQTNPHGALTFYWKELQRQVRVEGRCERLTGEESQGYYDTRIRGSRIGAWASEQSRVLEGREELEKRVEDVEKRFVGKESIPVPEFWGGMRIVPDLVEFWQGRASRLHDRFRYTKEEGQGGEWKIDRLSP